MTHLALNLFGQPRVVLNGTQVHIGRRKSTALLVYLAVTNRSHSRDALASLFWPEYNQPDALAYLRRILSEFKKSLGETYLVIDRETASLNQASLWLDVTEFRQHLAVCKSHNHQAMESCEDCIPHMTEAVTLYRGDFLEGFTLRDSAPFDEWQLFQVENLRRELISVLERLVHWFLNHQAYETAFPYAQRWLEMDPLHEPAHVSLMMLYMNSGQKSSAMHQYQMCSKLLSEELGISPSKETTALYERIRVSSNVRSIQKLTTISSDHPLSVGHTIPNNLPAQLSSFIGREKEISDVQEMLLRDDIRLLTLTGPGGTGKTRLSLAVAQQVLNEFPDGVFFVPLASLRDPALVLDAIAQVFGLRDAGDMTLTEIIKINLRDKYLLLVLDNFEHVVQAATEITALLTVLPQLMVLVTSRALLRVTGEVNYPVQPMNLPDAETVQNIQFLAQNESVQLFVDRATAIKPGFTQTDKNVELVVEICRHLDGLPLAIELAAARIRLLPLQGLVSQLENRLHFLKGGPKDLPTRQRTLRSTIEWSYNLLGEEEQVLFRRLAVFAGGCTLESAEAICITPGELVDGKCIDILDCMEQLVDHSLLQQTVVAGFTRFTMLETIREYAHERLSECDEAGSLQQAHAYFYLDLAEKAEPELDGPEPALWLALLDSELDNFRTALAWALEHDVAVGLHLASALENFWISQARLTEGRNWLEQTITWSEEKNDIFLPLRGKALSAACEMAWCQGDSKKGIALGEQSVAIFRSLGDRCGLANALRSLGQATLSFPDSDMTLPILEESITLYKSIRDEIGLNKALIYYCWKLLHIGDYSQAHTTAEQCRQMAQKNGSVNALAAAHIMLGHVLSNKGNNNQALSHYEKSGTLFEEAGNKLFETEIVRSIGMELYILGQLDEAKEYYRKGSDLLKAIGNSANVAACSTFLAIIAYQQGYISESEAYCIESLEVSRNIEIHDYNVARCLLYLALVTDTIQNPYRVAVLIGAAEKFRAKTWFDQFNVRFEIDRLIDTLHNFMHKKDIDAAYNRGLSMTKEQAIDFALTEDEIAN